MTHTMQFTPAMYAALITSQKTQTRRFTHHLNPGTLVHALPPAGISHGNDQFIRITDKRYQYLHDITTEEIHAEGIPLNDPDPWLSFKTLWDSIHGHQDERCWSANPMVTVYTFERALI